ncbi:MAG: TonB family protein [Lacunisphaera sp.]|nr:TonB family protein [Lacunisphaera sp.]
MPAPNTVQSCLRPISLSVPQCSLAACLLMASALAGALVAQQAEPAQPDNRSAPVAIRTVSPKHPPELRRRLINGNAEIECLITEAGRVADTRVVSASQAEFGEAATEAVRQWEFRPGERNGIPTAMSVRIPFSFQMTNGEKLEILAGHALFEQVSDPVIPAQQLTSWPSPKQFVLPHYPEELRGSGKHGKAVVSIVINKEGKVVNPKIVKYTYPEFIWPALAAAVSLEFKPLKADKTPICVSMDLQFDFVAEAAKPKLAAPEIKNPPPRKNPGIDPPGTLPMRSR